MRTITHWIGGKPVESASGRFGPVYDPATGGRPGHRRGQRRAPRGPAAPHPWPARRGSVQLRAAGTAGRRHRPAGVDRPVPHDARRRHHPAQRPPVRGYLAGFASQEGTRLWRPYDIYPAPGGLLQWGTSEQADQFYWLTEGNDPDTWPVFVREDIPDSWRRFDGSAAEFVFRMLTERGHPFSTARYFDTHWFQSYEA